MSLRGPKTAYDRTLFTVAGVPVEISPWALIVFLIGGINLTGLTFFLVYLVQVLAHEGGHAFFAKRYGLRPRILIHGMGGWCSHGAPRFAWQDRNILLGGPAAGLTFAGLCWLGSQALGGVPGIGPALTAASWLGLVVNLVNLVPVLPLDGGGLAALWLRGRGWVSDDLHRWSLRIAVAVATLGPIFTGRPWLWSLFLYLAWSNAWELGLVPSLQISREVGLRQPVRRRPWWQPTVAVGVVVVVVLGLSAVPDLPSRVALETASVLAGEVWRLVAWPVGPATPVHATLFAVVWWFVGEALETRVRARGVALVAGVGLLGASVAGFAAGLLHLTGGPLTGPWPALWAALGAWAAFAPEAQALPNFQVGRAAVAVVALWIGASGLLNEAQYVEAVALWGAFGAGIWAARTWRAPPRTQPQGPHLRLVN